MPSRPVTLAIVALWLVATGWLIYRDLWEKAGQPPPFTLDLADEVGGRAAVWQVSQDGALAGFARVVVRRAPGRLFELAGEFRPDNFPSAGLMVKNLSSIYRVTPRGEMRGLSCSIGLILPSGVRQDVELEGRLEDGRFVPVVRRDGVVQEVPAAEAMEVGQVLNVLQPPHKVAGLYEGRTWRVALFDPRDLAGALGAGLARVPLRPAEAKVTADVLPEERREVACWRIDYREGDAVTVRTWVRVSDAVVLQQEVRHGGTEVVMQRKRLP